MNIDIFILGSMAEKPLNAISLINLADAIRIGRWTHSSKDSILERLETLKNMGYLKYADTSNDIFIEKTFISTEEGIIYYRNKIKNYLSNKEVNLGMLILALTFSNHFPKDEYVSIITKRILLLRQSIDKTKKLIPKEYISTFYNLGLNTTILLKENEIESLEIFLNYACRNNTWQDYLNNTVY